MISSGPVDRPQILDVQATLARGVRAPVFSSTAGSNPPWSRAPGWSCGKPVLNHSCVPVVFMYSRQPEAHDKLSPHATGCAR